MPLFHFKVEGDPDVDAIELPSVAVAKCEAVKYAGKRICDEADRFWDASLFTLNVTDDRGLSLFMLMMTGVQSAAVSD